MQNMAFDIGSFAGKFQTFNMSGSIISQGIQIGQHRQVDPNHDVVDITIHRTPKGVKAEPERWVLGADAHVYGNPIQFGTSMRRYESPLFYPMVCAMLLSGNTALHYSNDPLVSIDHRGSVEVSSVASISPSYHQANKEYMRDALRGTYDFWDNEANLMYSFAIREAMIVYEGFGIHRYSCYTNTGGHWRGRKVSEHKKKIAYFDFGGRTGDAFVINNGKLEGKGVLDTGVIRMSQSMISDDIMPVFGRMFNQQPLPIQVAEAMQSAKLVNTDRGKVFSGVFIDGINGERVDITEIVNQHANMFSFQVVQMYNDVMAGGTGIHKVVYGGGGGPTWAEYMGSRILHPRQELVSKNPVECYKANSVGSFGYLLERLGRLINQRG